ncbi:MAG TPA: cation-transporting P-type ATPase, partial [Gaiellaceae bacterium]|nr:cation-transporting P-type ATPase [Gaiellaceae bacterium]
MEGPLTAAPPPLPGNGPAGLSQNEAARLLAEVGPNVLTEQKRPSHALGFVRNLVHTFAVLLWAGALLAWVAGMPELSIAIVVVILVNAAFAFAQEYRAERATEALKAMLPQHARVRRDGQEVEVSAADLVPGDLLVLRPGDRISADAELVSRA